MKKLSLDLDALQVESFTTAREASARGTVRGAEDTYDCGSASIGAGGGCISGNPWCNQDYMSHDTGCLKCGPETME